MNRTIGGLMLVIVLLVGAVMYLLGQSHAGPAREPAAADVPAEEKAAAENDKAMEADSPLRSRPVRVGTGGPHADACRGIGSVANLPGGAKDFLAVREAPGAKAKRIDKLKDDAPVYICDQNEDGSWIGIVYQANGFLPTDDKCRAEETVGSIRPYEGPCLTGWVAAKYVVPRGQDSDEPFVPEPAAVSRYLFDIEGFGLTEAGAAASLYLKGDQRTEAEGGTVVDRGKRNCTQTGEGGERTWRCRTTYTYAR